MDVLVAAVLLIGSFLLSLALPPVRNLVLRRFGGWLYSQITADNRQERALDAQQAEVRRSDAEEHRRIRREVLEAVGVLEEGLTMSVGSYQGTLKIQQAASVLELHGPAGVQAPLQQLLNQIGAYPEGVPYDLQRRLMRPITAAIREWAEFQP